MFIKAFLERRLDSKKIYHSIDDLIKDACTVLRVTEEQVKHYLQCYPMYVIMLVK